MPNFYVDFNERLAETSFLAGDAFSAADITMLVTIDFASRAFDMLIPQNRRTLLHRYGIVAARLSAAA